MLHFWIASPQSESVQTHAAMTMPDNKARELPNYYLSLKIYIQSNVPKTNHRLGDELPLSWF